MKSVEDLGDLRGKRVVIRCDFNVPLDGDKITDDGRIKAALPTLEQLHALKALWTQEEAEFDGEHVQLERSFCWPKPVSTPHPPIYLGGESEAALNRLAEVGVPIVEGRVPDGLDSGDLVRVMRIGEGETTGQPLALALVLVAVIHGLARQRFIDPPSVPDQLVGRVLAALGAHDTDP